MSPIRSLSLWLAVTGICSGCGRVDRAEIRYPNMAFVSPYATDKYEMLTVHNPIAHENGENASLDKSEIPRLCFRIDGKRTFSLPDVTPEIAIEHRFRERSHTVQIAFAEDGRVTAYFGDLNRQQHPGLEIASSPEGPFYRFPLTREQIVKCFGAPADEFARDYPHSN